MLTIFIQNWLWIIALMTIAWGIYLIIKNPGIIDVFWPISIFLSGYHFSKLGPKNESALFMLALLFIWAVRLSGYLFFTRILPRIQEKRYSAIVSDSDAYKNLRFLMHFQFQGILAMIIASPFCFVGYHLHHSALLFLSSVIILIGIIGETLSDYQLHSFRKNQPGMVCNVGLWYYSRHPNYFFEWIIWVGFALAGFYFYYGWIGLVSPMLLLFLMLKFTIPITEKTSMKSRGKKYLDYQKITPIFFPKITALEYFK